MDNVIGFRQDICNFWLEGFISNKFNLIKVTLLYFYNIEYFKRS